MSRQENSPPEEMPNRKSGIDTNLIPDHVKEFLAATLVKSVRAFMQQPGGREYLERVIEERGLRK